MTNVELMAAMDTKFSGLRRVRALRPTRSRNPDKHGMGSATDMGGGYQRCPQKDFRKIKIQPCPRRGVNPQNFENTRHSRCHTIPTKSQGAVRIGGHGQPKDGQATKAGTTTARDCAISIGKRRRERPRRDNLRQRWSCTKKGKAKIKGKINATQSLIPLLVHVPITPPPPPRRQRTTSCRARSHTSRGRGGGDC